MFKRVASRRLMSGPWTCSAELVVFSRLWYQEYNIHCRGVNEHHLDETSERYRVVDICGGHNYVFDRGK